MRGNHLPLTHPSRVMDFTEIYKQTAFQCAFSPDARHLATAVDHRVVVRDATSLQIVQLYSCLARVHLVSWSPRDPALLLCASFSAPAPPPPGGAADIEPPRGSAAARDAGGVGRAAVQVFSLRDPEWTACIEEGLAGLTAVRWAPDSRHILAFSDFQLRITVWSLTDTEAVYHIQYPKFSNRGFGFRPDGRYFALAERREGKDTVSVYDCEDWSLLKHFPVETSDLEDLAWSPDGRYIAVWDSLLEYRVAIYHPDGRKAASYSAYEHGLGVKTVSWSPSGQFLAVGSYDGK
ncbi:WD repeat-containing protein wrap73, partial [Cladochytrium tenue]